MIFLATSDPFKIATNRVNTGKNDRKDLEWDIRGESAIVCHQN